MARKKVAKDNNQSKQLKKQLTAVQSWLMQGQEPDEKTQPILRMEQPTGALVDVGSLYPG
jgi:hypothetical protein